MILKKKNNTLLNVVIECKFLNNINDKDDRIKKLSKLVQYGLNQIKEKNYISRVKWQNTFYRSTHYNEEVYMKYEEMNLES